MALKLLFPNRVFLHKIYKKNQFVILSLNQWVTHNMKKQAYFIISLRIQISSFNY